MTVCANPACGAPLVRKEREPPNRFKRRKYCNQRCTGQGHSLVDWPEAENAKLDELWAAGLSTTQIGRELGKTKNQIVGKAHRRELPHRESPIIHPNSSLAAPPKRPEPPREQPQPVESGRGCAWPMWHHERPGEAGYGVFCGKPRKPGSPYCGGPDGHDRRAYAPQRKRDAGESAAA